MLDNWLSPTFGVEKILLTDALLTHSSKANKMRSALLFCLIFFAKLHKHSFMDNGNEAEVKVPYIFKFGRWPEKVIACISPCLNTFRNVCLKLDETVWSVTFWKSLTSDILQRAPNDPKLNKESDRRSNPYPVPRTAISKFSYVSLYEQPFSWYCTFYDYSVESH